LYTLVVTRFRLREKIATQMSIVLMAAISILGFGYRHFVDAGISFNQVQTWLCAFPVVLFMAPLGAYVLHRLNVEWMLRGIVVLNVAQLLYFNLKNPSFPKFAASVVFSIVLMISFVVTLARVSRNPVIADQTTDPAA
ncbi:MAG: sulfite exporter TauE/SafE family protein, partial [Chthoniobacterales bacterium]